jgi:hypothetical protein
MNKKITVRKPEAKRLLRKPRHRCEDNIKIYHKKLALGGCQLDSSSSGYRLVVDSSEYSNEPSGFIKGRDLD